MLADGVKDPRILGLVTVTAVEVTRDLRHAKVFVSVHGHGAGAQRATFEGLAGVAPHLRSRVGRRSRLRVAPEIEFRNDESIEHAARIETAARAGAKRSPTRRLTRPPPTKDEGRATDGAAAGGQAGRDDVARCRARGAPRARRVAHRSRGHARSVRHRAARPARSGARRGCCPTSTASPRSTRRRSRSARDRHRRSARRRRARARRRRATDAIARGDRARSRRASSRCRPTISAKQVGGASRVRCRARAALALALAPVRVDVIAWRDVVRDGDTLRARHLVRQRHLHPRARARPRPARRTVRRTSPRCGGCAAGRSASGTPSTSTTLRDGPRVLRRRAEALPSHPARPVGGEDAARLVARHAGRPGRTSPRSRARGRAERCAVAIAEAERRAVAAARRHAQGRVSVRFAELGATRGCPPRWAHGGHRRHVRWRAPRAPATCSRLVARARAHPGVRSVLVTFEPHPLEIVNPRRRRRCSRSRDEKLEVIAESGVDYVAIVPFTPELAQLRRRQFVDCDPAAALPHARAADRPRPRLRPRARGRRRAAPAARRGARLQGGRRVAPC